MPTVYPAAAGRGDVDTFVRTASEVIHAELAYANGASDGATGTPNPPFWVDAVRDDVPLGEVKVGIVLHVQGGGDRNARRAILVGKTWRKGDFEGAGLPVFDVEVENQHDDVVRAPGSAYAAVRVRDTCFDDLVGSLQEVANVNRPLVAEDEEESHR